LSYGKIDRALNGIDNSQELNQTIASVPSVSPSIANGIGNAIGEIASALFSPPQITPEQEDPFIKKRKKKKNNTLKR
jgi:hypothetical protein